MLTIQLTPFPTLRTARLTLRQLTTADTEAMYFFRSDADFLRYINREPEPELAQTQAHLRQLAELHARDEGIVWGLSPMGEETLLGTICLWNLQLNNQRAEIGYGLHPAYERQGFMTEALAEVVRFAFAELGLHSLEAQLDPANTASVRLLEKHGFRREAYFRENHFFRGQFLDGAVYSLLAPDWRSR